MWQLNLTLHPPSHSTWLFLSLHTAVGWGQCDGKSFFLSLLKSTLSLGPRLFEGEL